MYRPTHVNLYRLTVRHVDNHALVAYAKLMQKKKGAVISVVLVL